MAGHWECSIDKTHTGPFVAEWTQYRWIDQFDVMIEEDKPAFVGATCAQTDECAEGKATWIIDK